MGKRGPSIRQGRTVEFMPRPNQEQTARRFQPSSYECELPDDVRAQFVRPKRPRILERPLQEPRARSGVLKWLVALILASVISSWQREKAAVPERASSTGAISQPLAPQPIPIPAPTPGPT